MQLGLVVGSQHHLLQWATNPSGTELASHAVWWALQPFFWGLYLISSAKSCDRVTNATVQQWKKKNKEKKHSCSWALCLCPLPALTHISKGPASGTALHAQHTERKALWSPAACVYFPSPTHTILSSKEGRNVWHFCGDYLAEASLHFLASQPRS